MEEVCDGAEGRNQTKVGLKGQSSLGVSVLLARRNQTKVGLKARDSGWGSPARP